MGNLNRSVIVTKSAHGGSLWLFSLASAMIFEGSKLVSNKSNDQ